MCRFRFVAVMVCSFSLLFGPAIAQQPVSPPISAQALLQQSLAAQLGNAQISDVTLTGTVRRIAGSNDESGTATLKALSTGETSAEIRFNSVKGPAGSWKGQDGTEHPTPFHNLQAGSSWFFPHFLMTRTLGSPG